MAAERGRCSGSVAIIFWYQSVSQSFCQSFSLFDVPLFLLWPFIPPWSNIGAEGVIIKANKFDIVPS